METNWTSLHPEYAGNPFISMLPGPQPIRSDEALLRMDVVFDEGERQHAPYHRRMFSRRILDYMLPTRNQTLIPEAIRLSIYDGYKHRNPNISDYKAKILESTDQLFEVRANNKKYHELQSPAPTKGVPGFCLLGCPGMGKSLTIDRTISVYPKKIVHRIGDAGAKITQVPVLKVECPSSGSRKALCIDILKILGEIVGLDLLRLVGKSFGATGSASADVLMMYVQHQFLICAVGILIVDEIQNISKAKEGAETVMNFLVTLANRLQIPIILVGTPAAEAVLQYDFRIARRAAGSGSKRWDNLKYGTDFKQFVEGMWKYQWVSQPVPLTEDLIKIMYYESQGVLDIVVKLFYLVQKHLMEASELAGRPEIITADVIRHVAKQYLYLVAPMMSALRSRDPHALQKFPDLKPFHKFIADIVARAYLDDPDAQPDPSVVMEAHLAAEMVVEVASSEDAGLIAVMAGFGVPEGARAKLLLEVDRLTPNGDVRSRSETLGHLLNGRGKPKPRSKKLKPVYVPGDLRSIVSKGKDSQAGDGKRTGYDALKDAGVVRDCLDVVRELA